MVGSFLGATEVEPSISELAVWIRGQQANGLSDADILGMLSCQSGGDKLCFSTPCHDVNGNKICSNARINEALGLAGPGGMSRNLKIALGVGIVGTLYLALR